MSDVQQSGSVQVKEGKLVASGEIKFNDFVSLEASVKLNPLGAAEYLVHLTATTTDDTVLMAVKPFLQQALANVESKKLAGTP